MSPLKRIQNLTATKNKQGYKSQKDKQERQLRLRDRERREVEAVVLRQALHSISAAPRLPYHVVFHAPFHSHPTLPSSRRFDLGFVCVFRGVNFLPVVVAPARSGRRGGSHPGHVEQELATRSNSGKVGFASTNTVGRRLLYQVRTNNQDMRWRQV